MLEASCCNVRTVINRDSIDAYQGNTHNYILALLVFFYKEGKGLFFFAEEGVIGLRGSYRL